MARVLDFGFWCEEKEERTGKRKRRPEKGDEIEIVKS